MSQEDQPVSFLSLQHRRVALLAGLVVPRVAEEHRVPFALRRVLDDLQDQRKERI